MTPERYQQIGEIYHAVLAVDPEERAAFLDRACAGDEALRREVESLIASHEQASNFIATPALAVAAGLLAGRDSLVGQTIAHYRVISLVGEGGMGEVYLAEDTRLGRRVALKLLSSAFTNDADRMRRFMQEARAASALNHPNILTVHEIGRTDGIDFIATEFIEGETLRPSMAKRQLRLTQALDIAAQVAGALAAAHAAGVVHRDIKPENIMLRPDGYVKVLDFGLAKLAGPGLQMGNEASTIAKVETNPGVVMGTVQYMSPEQARGLPVDARTDVWSLGVVLYEMVANRAPFKGETHSDTIVSILEREPAPLVLQAPEVSAELERIVTKALTKDKDERYQTVKDMAIDLRRLRRRLDVDAEIERSQSAQSASGSVAVAISSGAQQSEPDQTQIQSAARTSYADASRRTSSVEYAIDEIKRHRRGVALLGTVLILLLGGLSYGLYKLAHRPDSAVPPFQAVKMTRLTAMGKVSDAAISPDGKYVVYTQENEKQVSLWVRQVASGSTVQIVPPADVMYFGLTFSNDSNYIYYVKVVTNDSPWMLYQVPTLGGSSKKVIDRVESAVTFSPDGRRLAFVRADPPRGESSLVIANTDGTGEQTLATRKMPDFFHTEGLSKISWSPDGKIIASPAGSTDANGFYYNVIGVRVKDSTEEILTSQRWGWISQVAWLSDGSGLAIVGMHGEVSASQLWSLSYPGGEVRRITSDLNQYRDVSLSGDSRMLVTVQTNRVANIWIAPKGDAARAKQVTSGTSDSLGLSWTPDGRIVYQSDASGQSQIWLMNADGSEQKQLTADGYNYRPAIGIKGRYVVFHSRRAGATNIWRMDLDGGNLKQLTHGKQNIFPDISPDEQWVVYSSVDSGELTLWKISIDGGDPARLSDPVANLASISPDGKYIASFYWDEKANPPTGIMILPFAGGPPIRRFNFLPDAINGFALHWSLDGLSVLRLDDNLSNIWSQPINGGSPTQLTHFQGNRIFNFAWSQDGKSLALARGTVTRDVVLIEDLK
ncbi:MAG: protein kinase [bacterium]